MGDGIEIQASGKMCEPTRHDVELVATLPPAWLSRSGGYWQTLYSLLMAGFCLAVTCAPAFGQSFTVEVVRPVQAFTVVVTERAVVKDSLTTDEPEYYIYTFTADYCALCQSDKRSGKHDAIKKRWPYSVVIDVAVDDQWIRARDMKVNKLPRVERLPTVWLMKRGDGRHVLKSWTGSTSIETIEAEIARIRSKPITATTADTGTHERNQSLFGRVGTSHESRETLINHLLNQGIHRGKFRMENLSQMSDDVLDQMHSNDHGW